nr:Chain F, PROTEIN (CYTOCHROME P450 BM-3) [Priestia megaterium]
PSPSTEQSAKKVRKKAENAHNTPLLVLYGSNMGTAEGTARDLADIAMSKGFAPQVATLDSHAGNLPREGAVLIVTASYNGHPPDNAKQFVDWLDQASADEVKGVRYSVFGCGDKNWATTYQKVPAFIDETLAAKGAENIADRGEADASDDFEGTYEEWREHMWSDVAAYFNLDIENSEDNKSTLSLQFVDS